MPRPTSRLASGRCFDASIAASRLSTEISPKPSRPSRSLLVEAVDVARRRATRPALLKQEHRSLAEALDVHRAARGEVDDALVALGGAVDVECRTCRSRPRARTSGSPQARARRRELPRLRALRPLGQHRADDLGDHVAGLAHDDGVAGAHVLERAPGPRCAAWPAPTVEPPTNTGSSMRERRGLPGAADRHHDVAAASSCVPRAGTCRRSPTAAPCAWTPSSLALREVVDLHDHAVDLVGEVVAVLLPAAGRTRSTASSVVERA